MVQPEATLPRNIPVPAATRPNVPVLQPMKTTPTVPLPTRPGTPTRPGSGKGGLVATAPTARETPVSPGYQAGVQVEGVTSIRSTTLTPIIPDVTGNRAQAPTALNVGGRREIPTIKMPTFSTAVAPVVITENRRPIVVQQGERAPVIPGTADNLIAVLNEIDPNLLVAERIGKNKKGYSLEALQAFAQRLGLTVSAKRKQELIDNIQKMRRDMGFT